MHIHIRFLSIIKLVIDFVLVKQAKFMPFHMFVGILSSLVISLYKIKIVLHKISKCRQVTRPLVPKF